MLSGRNLVKRFPIKGGILSREVASVKAVSDVSFDIRKGETLGIVGESGCGKSTLGRCILRLVEPTEGEIVFLGREFSKINKREMHRIRRNLQMVFQNPFDTLNPKRTIRQILLEPLIAHKIPAERREKLIEET